MGDNNNGNKVRTPTPYHHLHQDLILHLQVLGVTVRLLLLLLVRSLLRKYQPPSVVVEEPVRVHMNNQMVNQHQLYHSQQH